MSLSNGTGLEALKCSFRPFRIVVATESGDSLTVWSLPMRFDVIEEHQRRAAAVVRLKDTGLGGTELEAALNADLLMEYLSDHLVKAPAHADSGFATDERPEPLFDGTAQVKEYLSYNAMMRIRLAIQESGLKFAPEPALKN